MTVHRLLWSAGARILLNPAVLDAIIRSMPSPLMLLASDGTPLVWNHALASWLPEDVHRRGVDAFSEAELPESIRGYIKQARCASSPLQNQTLHVEAATGSDGAPRRFTATASSMFDREGQHLGYLLVGHEVTDLPRIAQDAQAQQRKILTTAKALLGTQNASAQYEQYEKMVSLGILAAGIAHELGNPLASLSSMVQWLKERAHSPEEQAHLHTLAEQVKRMVTIVRQIVEFARPVAGMPSSVDLDALIERIVKLTRFSRRCRRARIESVRNRNLPRVSIVPHRFEQILLNLLLNAVDAVEEMGGERLVIKIERSVQDGWVTVWIKDRGCGMTEEQLRHAFKPFYTTKPHDKGTGLGLTVTSRLVEQQGGRIRITSAPGQGTEIAVSFRTSRPTTKTTDTAGAAGMDTTP